MLHRADLTEDSPTCSKQQTTTTDKLSVISWNVDGLDTDNLANRAKGLCSVLVSYKPDVVFLQELIPNYIRNLKKWAVSPDFTGMLLKNSRVTLLESEIVTYPTTKMTRNLLVAKVAKVGLPSGVLDVWERLGKQEQCRYTWDTKANTNTRIPHISRFRFDRVYLRPATREGVPHQTPDNMALVGLQKLDCGLGDRWRWGPGDRQVEAVMDRFVTKAKRIRIEEVEEEPPLPDNVQEWPASADNREDEEDEDMELLDDVENIPVQQAPTEDDIGIAQRGHREDEPSANRGNFLEILDGISVFNETVAKKCVNSPKNAKYTHHDIQDEVFEIMSDMIRREISEEIQEADCFALMVDESKDVSKVEQVSVCVRYLKGEEIKEEFLHFRHADGLDADSLLQTIKKTLILCNIDKSLCVGQCYDGAAVMSGPKNGVQVKFRAEVPQAIYIHCSCHRLNLILVEVVKSVLAAAEFFETVTLLYNFFAHSVAHDFFIKKQKEMQPTSPTVELKGLSDTRWSCQYTALVAIRKSLPAIKQTLQDIMGQTHAKRKTDARAVNALLDERFVLLLTLFEDLFRVTKFMSDQLQAPNLELSASMDLAVSVTESLSDKRTEETWNEICRKAEDLSTKAGIKQAEIQKRATQPPKHLQGYHVEAPIESRPPQTLEDLRTDCFYPVIDRLMMEMERRFSAEASGVLTGVSGLNPKHASFLEKECLMPMATFYGVREENLSTELHMVKRLLERKESQGHKVNNMSEFLALLQPYQEAFIDLYKLLCISLNLPVTSASCERSFSCLRRVKNYLRNRSRENRNSNLNFLAINSDRTKALDLEHIIDIFATNHKNRRIVLL
ncbi:zinc finger MYM-type protein 1-like [Diretmus argenteus]